MSACLLTSSTAHGADRRCSKWGLHCAARMCDAAALPAVGCGANAGQHGCAFELSSVCGLSSPPSSIPACMETCLHPRWQATIHDILSICRPRGSVPPPPRARPSEPLQSGLRAAMTRWVLGDPAGGLSLRSRVTNLASSAAAADTWRRCPAFADAAGAGGRGL